MTPRRPLGRFRRVSVLLINGFALWQQRHESLCACFESGAARAHSTFGAKTFKNAAIVEAPPDAARSARRGTGIGVGIQSALRRSSVCLFRMRVSFLS